MKFNSFTWLFPFIAFFSGYFLLHLYIGSSDIELPYLVGMPLEKALLLISQHDLSIRIIDVKEDIKSAPGTILGQCPAATTKMRKGQIIYCVIAKQPSIQLMPSLIGKTQDEIAILLDHRGIDAKKYNLDSDFPPTMCFAQFPASGTSLENKQIYIYLASDKKKIIIWPSFIGKTVEQVKEWGAKNHISVNFDQKENTEIAHEDHCIIIDQKPLAHAFIAFPSASFEASFRTRPPTSNTLSSFAF